MNAPEFDADLVAHRLLMETYERKPASPEEAAEFMNRRLAKLRKDAETTRATSTTAGKAELLELFRRLDLLDGVKR